MTNSASTPDLTHISRPPSSFSLSPAGVAPADLFPYHVQCGEIAWRKGELEIAVSHYDRAHYLNPTDARPLLPLAKIFRELGRPFEILRYFAQAISEHCKNGAFEDARFLLEELLQNAHEHFSFHPDFIQLKSGDEATVGASDLTGHDRTLNKIHGLLGVLNQHKEPALMVQYCRLFSQVDPKNPDVRLLLARWLTKLGKTEEAVTHLLKASKVLLHGKKIDAVYDVLEEAAELAPGHPDIKAVFFRLQMVEGYIELGLESLEKLHVVHPENMEIIKTRAHALLALDRLEEARDCFFDVLCLEGGNTSYLEDIAYRLRAQGKTEQARETLVATAHYFSRFGKQKHAHVLLRKAHHEFLQSDD